MTDKAILFDGSRCAACQACVAACKGHIGAPWEAEEDNGPVADAYQRPADLDGSTPLVIALAEREVAGRGIVWEPARTGCSRCAEAPCAGVCPTGALSLTEAGDLTGPEASRCVSCGMCSAVCPVAAPRSSGDHGPVRLCDGCADAVAAGGMPACAAACPADALAFGNREEIVAVANDRVAALRERGYERACVLGAAEQGGHFVVQVLKYGVEGHANEGFAMAEEIPWISAVKMAGPVSVGVLAVGAVGAAAALAVEANRARRERREAMRVPVNAYGAPVAADGGAPGIDGGDVAAGAGTSGAVTPSDESALDAAVRKRDALRARAAAASPAAAAAAAAAASGEEPHLIPVAFSDEPVPGGADEPASRDGVVSPEGAACSLVGDADDTGEIPVVGDADDTGEIPVVDEVGDTGELYNLDDFRRLLAADLVAHHVAKQAVESAEGDEGNEGSENAEDDEPVPPAHAGEPTASRSAGEGEPSPGTDEPASPTNTDEES